MTVNSRAARVVALAVLLACAVSPVTFADEPVLRMRATVAAANATPLTIELLRWSTDAERAPLVSALAAPPPPARGAAPPAGGAAAPAAAGRGARGGRGGGRGAAAPLSPEARLSAAVKAAPTVGFVWGDGPTGYAIRYAWRDAAGDAARRIVLVTDRRLGVHWPAPPQGSVPPGDDDFTVLELRLDSKGSWEGKTSLTTKAIADPAAQSLALDRYAEAPVLLKVTP